MGDEVKGRVEWFKDYQFIGRIKNNSCSVILGEGGISPMKLLLLSVAGCTAYDVVMILQKMREPIEGLEVEIGGERREEHPRIYKKVHIHYKIYGDVSEEKAKRAIELSQDKYCSASAHIKLSGAELTYSFEIIKS
ncbi:OsmC family peroxiredoxin [Thermococcus sp. GR7]|uniref:OsmC family protein n=1 Tax=unclassified Thermococcus TaxID=2627626 RepID=UPI0014301D2A|nr:MULTISPECIES: OsmC family protein [unclassified Thermococcus]NJE46871.1 OsmC family peroxiredoxin [Thermococcus sp. GR7]NJE78368.1 OsmC family peroxiredoxin [Thermococcus sp. GR4]NJF23335.1 OsmC family peroxiredoxin [Thermococcus sp. GR5]